MGPKIQGVWLATGPPTTMTKSSDLHDYHKFHRSTVGGPDPGTSPARHRPRARLGPLTRALDSLVHYVSSRVSLPYNVLALRLYAPVSSSAEPCSAGCPKRRIVGDLSYMRRPEEGCHGERRMRGADEN